MTIDYVVIKAQEQLKRLGFEKFADDTKLIFYYAELVFEEVTDNINWDTIPKKLERTYIDMVCGEYLYFLYTKGDLKPDTEGVELGMLTSGKAGNVSFNINGGSTSEDRLLALINGLRHIPDRRYLFDIFRRYLD